MKKITAILLCLIFVLGAAACSTSPTNSGDGDSTTPAVTTPGTVDKLTYANIIEKFTALVSAKLNGMTLVQPSDTANTIETALFEIVRDTSKPTAMGYATKDINNDGAEELILLNDQYDTLALFTEKDGCAHFVDGAYGAWIDGDGRLRKAVSTGGLVSRDGECYVYTLDGTALKAEVAVGYKVNVYLQKEGWYKIEGKNKINVSAEEGKALYAAYDILPSGFSNEEYTRTFSGIEFTPLFEATLAGKEHINTFSNSQFVNGNTLTVSEITENDVTAAIKFVYTEGEFDPETGVEPAVYVTELNVSAAHNGSRYEFEKDGVKGYIEFAVNAAWIVVTESHNEYVFVRAYIFDRPEN